MNRHNTYSLFVDNMWFQNGKLTNEPDWSRDFSNSKSFQTRKKLNSFLTYVFKTFPEKGCKISINRYKETPIVFYIEGIKND